MGDKLYIVIPAYNEEENIEAVIRDWHPVVEKVGPESRLDVTGTPHLNDVLETQRS